LSRCCGWCYQEIRRSTKGDCKIPDCSRAGVRVSGGARLLRLSALCACEMRDIVAGCAMKDKSVHIGIEFLCPLCSSTPAAWLCFLGLQGGRRAGRNSCCLPLRLFVWLSDKVQPSFFEFSTLFHPQGIETPLHWFCRFRVGRMTLKGRHCLFHKGCVYQVRYVITLVQNLFGGRTIKSLPVPFLSLTGCHRLRRCTPFCSSKV